MGAVAAGVWASVAGGWLATTSEHWRQAWDLLISGEMDDPLARAGTTMLAGAAALLGLGSLGRVLRQRPWRPHMGGAHLIRRVQFPDRLADQMPDQATSTADPPARTAARLAAERPPGSQRGDGLSRTSENRGREIADGGAGGGEKSGESAGRSGSTAGQAGPGSAGVHFAKDAHSDGTPAQTTPRAAQSAGGGAGGQPDEAGAERATGVGPPEAGSGLVEFPPVPDEQRQQALERFIAMFDAPVDEQAVAWDRTGREAAGAFVDEPPAEDDAAEQEAALRAFLEDRGRYPEIPEDWAEREREDRRDRDLGSEADLDTEATGPVVGTDPVVVSSWPWEGASSPAKPAAQEREAGGGAPQRLTARDVFDRYDGPVFCLFGANSSMKAPREELLAIAYVRSGRIELSETAEVMGKSETSVRSLARRTVQDGWLEFLGERYWRVHDDMETDLGLLTQAVQDKDRASAEAVAKAIGPPLPRLEKEWLDSRELGVTPREALRQYADRVLAMAVDEWPESKPLRQAMDKLYSDLYSDLDD